MQRHNDMCGNDATGCTFSHSCEPRTEFETCYLATQYDSRAHAGYRFRATACIMLRRDSKVVWRQIPVRQPTTIALESTVKPHILALAGALAVPIIASAQISQVAYGTLSGTQLVTFDDIVGGGQPGTNYNSIFYSNGVGFAERFVGQTVTASGDNDQLGGSPSGGGLALQTGAADRNLNVFFYTTSQVMTGLGPRGFPNADAIGEGAFAALFSSGQSQFGFQLVGGGGGTAFLSFFRADGSLIQNISLGGLSDTFYGFSRDGGLQDIFGISLWNDDSGGIGFDNLKFDVQSVNPNVVPEPATYALFSAGLVVIGATIRRRRGSKS